LKNRLFCDIHKFFVPLRNKISIAMKTILKFSALTAAFMWCIGIYSLHAQTNDTMYIHKGQNVIKHAIKDVDSITFYLSEKETPFLIVDETPIVATAESGTYYIAVSSNGEWAAVAENTEWIELTKKNNDTLVVNIEKNTDTVPRSATIKISLGSLEKSVAVNQEGRKDSLCTDCPCGVENPQEELPWLADLIEKAKNDQTTAFWGRIWLIKYEGVDIFVTDMHLGSGGVRYWFFDCYGNHFVEYGELYDGLCSACRYVGNHHVFFRDIFPNSRHPREIVGSLIRSGAATLIYSRY
jgi:hypothetical protein